MFGKVVLVVLAAAGVFASEHASNARMGTDLMDTVLAVASRYMDMESSTDLVELKSTKAEIINALLGIQQEIMADQKADAAKFTSAQSYLSNAIKTNQAHLQDIQGDRGAAQKVVQSLPAEIANLKHDLAATDSDNGQIRGYEAQLRADLNVATTQFSNDQRELTDAIAAHQRSLQLVKDIITSLKQADLNVHHFVEQLSTQTHEYMHEDVEPVTVLVQDAIDSLRLLEEQDQGESVGEAALQEAVGILEQVVAGIQASAKVYTAQLQEDRTEFAALQQATNALIAQFDRQLQLNAQGASLLSTDVQTGQTRLKLVQGALDTLSAQITQLQALLARLHSQQESDAKEYEARVQIRNKELAALESAIAWVNKNMEGVGVAGLCNPKSSACERCLKDTHCAKGYECGNEGQCVEVTKHEIYGSADETTTLKLSCPAGQTIGQVAFASYGLPDGTTISPKCHAPSSVSVAQAQCLHRTSCSIQAGNSVFGDPCVGTRKHLNVALICTAALVPMSAPPLTHAPAQPQQQSHEIFGSADETTTLALSCPSGQTVSAVAFASYGLPDRTTISPKCHAPSSAAVAQQACLHRPSCSIQAANSVFGDPCYGTRKHLNLALICSGPAPAPPQPQTHEIFGSADETTTLALSCPAGQTVSAVAFASYGLPDRTTISPKCHAASSAAVAQQACLHRPSCSIQAANSVFGDPCYGTRKHLNLALICSGPAPAPSQPQTHEIFGSADETTTLALSCPAGQTVSAVAFASYGLPEGGMISSKCHASSSAAVAQQACLHRPSCSIQAVNSVFGDPCYGIRKHLNVALICSN
ncbi:unnamed protein product (mitochondrion) [Plasmodiophora brassicae]|uniref:SUEL-type lectin domain-containing protein n=1 Tax=Plasmodiophora brassicae TaxID=37360 RepID=A0A3P3XZB1_PLABS|nr:unnamed protein product [Plasmodiophora brassicae]